MAASKLLLIAAPQLQESAEEPLYTTHFARDVEIKLALAEQRFEVDLFPDLIVRLDSATWLQMFRWKRRWHSWHSWSLCKVQSIGYDIVIQANSSQPVDLRIPPSTYFQCRAYWAYCQKRWMSIAMHRLPSAVTWDILRRGLTLELHVELSTSGAWPCEFAQSTRVFSKCFQCFRVTLCCEILRSSQQRQRVGMWLKTFALWSLWSLHVLFPSIQNISEVWVFVWAQAQTFLYLWSPSLLPISKH